MYVIIIIIIIIIIINIIIIIIIIIVIIIPTEHFRSEKLHNFSYHTTADFNA